MLLQNDLKLQQERQKMILIKIEDGIDKVRLSPSYYKTTKQLDLQGFLRFLIYWVIYKEGKIVWNINS